MGFWGNVAAGVVVAAIGLLVPDLRDWLFTVAGAVWAHFFRVTELPNWLVWLLALLASGWAFLAFAYLARHRATRIDPDHWSGYTKDHFKGALWEWRYVGNNIQGLMPYCPRCESALVYENSFAYGEETRVRLFCERCNTNLVQERGDFSYLKGSIERQIVRNVRTNEYPKPSDQGNPQR